MNRIIVHTMDGNKWRSDAEDIPDDARASLHSMFSNMSAMNGLNIRCEGQTVYFNPSYVVTVIITDE